MCWRAVGYIASISESHASHRKWIGANFALRQTTFSRSPLSLGQTKIKLAHFGQHNSTVAQFNQKLFKSQQPKPVCTELMRSSTVPYMQYGFTTTLPMLLINRWPNVSLPPTDYIYWVNEPHTEHPPSLTIYFTISPTSLSLPLCVS